MPTSNPKVSAYVPQHIFDKFKAFYKERELSMSQAVIEVFAHYFGLNLEEPTQEYTGGLPGKLLQVEKSLEELKELYLSLASQVENIQTTSRLLKNDTPDSLVEPLSKPLSELENETFQATEQYETDGGLFVGLPSELQSKLPDKEPKEDIGVADRSTPQAISPLNSGLESGNELKVDEAEVILSIQPLSAGELSKRLKMDPSTIIKYKNGKRKQNLAEWSKNVDPDGVAWEYSGEQKKYIPLNQGELIIGLQGELLKADSSNSN